MENSDIANLLIERFIESEEYKSLNIDNVKNIFGLKGGSDALFFASIFKDKGESFLIIKENEIMSTTIKIIIDISITSLDLSFKKTTFLIIL